ncbi:hypothetical protein DL765_005688 [Monosporascus sp. GIB2]|nr:hypothetical protein DL765_005688 [Monosporascus sp. GIB2]
MTKWAKGAPMIFFKPEPEPQYPSLTITQQRVLDRYRIGVERLPIHEVEATDNVEEFQPSGDTWRLIELAAQKSGDAYSKSLKLSPNSPSFELKPSQDSKRILGTVTDGVLVVSIRGSASIMDWMVNGNGEPTVSQDLGETTAKYHKGFLAVAEAIQERLAERILATVTKLKSQTPEAPEDIDLLLTGHSAGGAMAQLFYVMAASESSRRAIATVAPNFRRVHCIVFGAPPITTIPIDPPTRDPFQSGIFLSIINEGDPVPLLQQDYFHALLEVFVLSPEGLKKKYPHGFKVPDPVFRVSGPCIVLRDKDASDVDVREWNAVKIREEMLERKLFGNVGVHRKNEYLDRCKSLASKMAPSQDEA